MEPIIQKAKNEFQKIIECVISESQKEELNEVEEKILKSLLYLGKVLLECHVEQRSKEKITSEVQTSKKPLLKTRNYYSIFGKIKLKRKYYWKKGQGFFPLDKELNLPEKSYSYTLSKWVTLFASRGAYNKVGDMVQELLGLRICNETIKLMVCDASKSAESFYRNSDLPPRDSEGEILVATIDCKGIPMKRSAPKGRKRLKSGEKPGKKKMATVTALYSVDKHHRTVDDIIEDIQDKSQKQQIPKPKNKIVSATLQAKDKAYEKLAFDVRRRTKENFKDKVVLLDGERVLRNLSKKYLQGFSIILDLFHVLEYLWDTSLIYYQKGSDESQEWVTSKLRLLLEGRVSDILTQLKYDYDNKKWGVWKRYLFRRAISYLENGQEYMKYNVYLDKGYPIASGVIEGTCRNLVKDRFELTGMHWSIDGAEALLQIRSLDINQKFNLFWQFRSQQEFYRRYCVDSPIQQQVT